MDVHDPYREVGHCLFVVVQRLAGEVGFFGDEPLLLVLLVAIVLVLGNVGTLARITQCVEVATVDIFETSRSRSLMEFKTSIKSSLSLSLSIKC